eukprot:107864-Rhodomonas_salina.3
MEGKVLEAIEILRSTRVEEPADIMPEMPATPQAAPSPAALNLQKKVRRQSRAKKEARPAAGQSPRWGGRELMERLSAYPIEEI